MDDLPQQFYAVHYRVARLTVDPAVKFKARKGRFQCSREPVAVYAEDGVVYIKRTVPSGFMALDVISAT